MMGLVLGSFLMFVVFWMFRKVRPRKVDEIFRVGQLISAGLYSIGHGGNDAQKTAGVIWAVMIAGGMLAPTATSEDPAPYWIFVASYGAMAFGTAIGGWRIVKTMGMGLTHLKPVGGFCAEVAGAITLFLATYLQDPGLDDPHDHRRDRRRRLGRPSARGIRWGLATRIVWAWIFTIPRRPLRSARGSYCIAHAIGAW